MYSCALLQNNKSEAGDYEILIDHIAQVTCTRRERRKVNINDLSGFLSGSPYNFWCIKSPIPNSPQKLFIICDFKVALVANFKIVKPEKSLIMVGDSFSIAQFSI